MFLTILISDGAGLTGGRVAVVAVGQVNADLLGCTVEEAARKVLEFAALKNSKMAIQHGSVFAVEHDKVEKKLFGLVKRPLRLIDEEGVIRLQKKNAWARWNWQAAASAPPRGHAPPPV